MWEPVFHRQYISLLLDASFHSLEAMVKRTQGENVQPAFPVIPVYAGDPSSADAPRAEIFISDVAINVGLLTWFENEDL